MKKAAWVTLVVTAALSIFLTKAESAEQASPRFIETETERLNYDGVPSEKRIANPQLPDQDLLLPSIPAYIATDSKLVFESYRDRNWEIYIANGDGSNQTRLTYYGNLDLMPRLNRGCTRIVFATDDGDDLEIAVMNPDGSGKTFLTNNNVNDVYPAWSPDGTKIAFQTYRDGQAEIYVMNADGSAPTRLTYDGDYDGMPSWSPDGSQIAFVSRRTGGYRVYRMNTDGSGLTRLSDQPYSSNPAWSPDGTAIAYDADGDNDGWREIWLMTAEGQNQKVSFKAQGYQSDVEVRSWSADGQYIAFTNIYWIYYEGSWYWTNAYMSLLDPVNMSGININSTNMDWSPDLQTLDIQFPDSNIHPLPAESPGPFTVSWSGYDPGPSGLKTYDIQVKEEADGTWTDWLMSTTQTSNSYPGIGGKTYYFRSRARDWAWNLEPWPPGYDTMTRVENYPPQSEVEHLPAYSRNSINIHWGGRDPGGSGIQTYDLQVRDGEGAWTDLQSGVTGTDMAFSGDSGHAYSFRVRARDKAQNLESWPAGDGDASTTFYNWQISGYGYDNRGAVLTGVSAISDPVAMGIISSTSGEEYITYVSSLSNQSSVSWSKKGYGSLPGTGFGTAEDAVFDVVLPPADNLVQDGDFERGGTGQPGWSTGGAVSPVITNTTFHTGQWGAVLGDTRPVASTPINLSKIAASVEGPKVITGLNGEVHVAWYTIDYTYHGEVLYTHRDASGEWSDIENLSHNSGSAFEDWMVMDSQGVVHVMWIDDSDGDYDIYYVNRSTNGTWTEPVNVSETSGYSSSLRMVLDKDGAIHAVWVEQVYPEDIFYIRRSAGGSWSEPVNLSNNTGVSQRPQLGVDGLGTVHVAWDDDTTNAYERDIYYANLPAGGSWSGPVNISLTTEPASEAAMAVGEDGRVYLLYRDGWDKFYYTGRDTAGLWSNPELIASGVVYGFDALLVENGNFHILMNSGQSYGAYLYYMQRSADGTWIPMELVSFGRGGQMAIDKHGAIHFVYEIFGSTISPTWDLFYSRRGRDGGWLHRQLLFQTPDPSWIPSFNLDSNGVGHIAWPEGFGKDFLFYTEAQMVKPAGDSTLTQVIQGTIPVANPTLSFLYNFTYEQQGAAPESLNWFEVTVEDETSTTSVYSTTSDSNGWQHYWYDLSAWAGKNVTLSFNLHQTSANPVALAYLDEVTIGSTFSDIWVNLTSHPVAALPGNSVEYILTYGNQGSVPAEGVVISYQLPEQLSFVSASIPPTSNSGTLTWDVETLPAGSGPFSIIITATIDPEAILHSSFINVVQIVSNLAEIDKLNNQSQATTWVENRIYLPLVNRNY